MGAGCHAECRGKQKLPKSSYDSMDPGYKGVSVSLEASVHMLQPLACRSAELH